MAGWIWILIGFMIGLFGSVAAIIIINLYWDHLEEKTRRDSEQREAASEYHAKLQDFQFHPDLDTMPDRFKQYWELLCSKSVVHPQQDEVLRTEFIALVHALRHLETSLTDHIAKEKAYDEVIGELSEEVIFLRERIDSA